MCEDTEPWPGGTRDTREQQGGGRQGWGMPMAQVLLWAPRSWLSWTLRAQQ